MASVALGWVYFGEPVFVSQVVGAVLIFSAMALSVLPGKREPDPTLGEVDRAAAPEPAEPAPAMATAGTDPSV